MNVRMEKLNAARKVMVRIVQAREDGANFLPVILQLERCIATETGLSGDLARILGEAA